MSDIKCPPEKPGFFGIDYPQETAEQMQNLRANILVFDLDVQAARKKNKSDELNRLIQAWDIWKSTALAFCEAHDDWTDNVFTMEGQYQGLLYLCELQDYRKKFADLGGEVASPNPTDPKGQEPKSQVQDTISSITTLAVVGIAAYVIFAVIPRKN